MLEDGDHDAIVVDADGDVLSIAFVTGAHKGELVEVRATGLGRDPLDLLAEPCVLKIRDGQPTVVFD